jgi:glycogen debranching enzyme
MLSNYDGQICNMARALGNLGTIKASILPPYIYAVNHFFKDYGRDPLALGV